MRSEWFDCQTGNPTLHLLPPPEQCVLPTSHPNMYATGKEMERKLISPWFKESLLSKRDKCILPKWVRHMYTSSIILSLEKCLISGDLITKLRKIKNWFKKQFLVLRESKISNSTKSKLPFTLARWESSVADYGKGKAFLYLNFHGSSQSDLNNRIFCWTTQSWQYILCSVYCTSYLPAHFWIQF